MKKINPATNDPAKNKIIKNCFRKIIEAAGENPDRQGLRDTAARAAKAFSYMTSGYFQSVPDVVNGALFDSFSDEMIIIRNIELYSLCEHHLLPFIGKCHIAYLPKEKILGISKIARIVDIFARRLQVQERLTKEIAHGIHETVEGHGVGVIIEARHLCMMMRGVEKQNSSMTTSIMLGTFRTDRRTRAEFLSLINTG